MLERVAREAGVELVYPEDEAEKHDGARTATWRGRPRRRARRRRHDASRLEADARHGPPVIGVNFGAVGFLTSITADELEARPRARVRRRLRRRRAADDRGRGRRRAHVAVNDVVVASSIIGRMIELGWAIGGEDLGVLACDGVICSTPSGLDRLQPLERRAGARLGARRADGDLHRGALAARAAARRARAGATSRSRIARPTCRPQVLVDGQPVTQLAAASGSSLGSARAHACSRTCRGDVLQALSGDICFVGSGSRTSCSFARPTSSRDPG